VALFLAGGLLVNWPAEIAAQPPAADAPPAEEPEPPPMPDPKYRLEDLQTPSYEELLTGQPHDWIVTSNDDVFIVDSVVPRPNTLDKRRQEIIRKEDERRVANPDNRQRLTQELEDLKFLYVSLANVQGNAERRLPILTIKEIIHHEDLMLRRIDALLTEKNVQQAFELLLRLERNWENWPGLDVMHNRFLLTDGQSRLEQGNPLGALTVLRELHARDATFTGLSTSYGEATDQLVAAAIQQDDYRRATFHLNDLANRFPNHPVFQRYNEELSRQVRDLISQAAAAAAGQQFREATLHVEEAARIWPRTPELLPEYRKHVTRFQRLHVGVVELPGDGEAFFLPTPADQRIRPLTTLSLFEVHRLRDGTAYYRTRFLDEWEPFDLGRRMKFTIRQFRQPADLHNVLTAADIVTQLLRRIDPRHPEFDERLSSYIRSVAVHSPQEFTIDFRRVPPRIEPLLAQIRFTAGQVELTATETDAEDSLAADPTRIGPLNHPGGFVPGEVTVDRFSLLRGLPEPEGTALWHVAEVVERRYKNHEEAMQGLQRGEVALLPDVPDWIVRRLQADEAFRQTFDVLPLRLPVVQVLQFNPASRVLRSRELRRGLEYAVDRERLLKEVVLKDASLQHGRMVTGPFFSNSPARHVLVQPRRFDVSSAIAMVVAAKKVLTASQVISNETLPTLRLVVEPGPIQEEVARDIARIWTKIGVPIEVVPGNAAAPESWDIMLRSLQMYEPLVEIWPFLTVSERAQLSDLDDYPDWLKQEIVDLDRTSDQSRALVKMQDLHRRLWADAAVIPLWEQDRFMVVRKTIKGVPAQPLHCYDNLEFWSIDPWFPVD
jgi:ABC-type transport system substrate-binding protein